MHKNVIRQNLKKSIFFVIKNAFFLLILYFLISSVIKNHIFKEIWDGPKNYYLLSIGFLCYLISVFLSLLRWHILVHSLNISIPFWKTLRIGIVSLFVSMLPVGALIGGDISKAWMLSRNHIGKGAESLASIIVDRFIGLFSMFTYVSIIAFVSDFHSSALGWAKYLCWGTTITSILFACIFCIFLYCPDFLYDKLLNILGRIFYIGSFLQRLAKAVRFYKTKPFLLIAAFFIGFFIQTLLATMLHFAGCGLFENTQNYIKNLTIIPISIGTVYIPIPIGPMEVVLDWFYTHTAHANGTFGKAGVGIIIAIVFRFYIMCVAFLGFFYYLFCPNDISTSKLREK